MVEGEEYNLAWVVVDETVAWVLEEEVMAEAIV